MVGELASQAAGTSFMAVEGIARITITVCWKNMHLDAWNARLLVIHAAWWCGQHMVIVALSQLIITLDILMDGSCDNS